MSYTTKTDEKAQGRGWILAALMFTTMLAAMDTTIVSTAIPHIVGDLGGFSLFSWVYSVYLLAQTVTIPLYGKLADLFGRKPVLIVGTVIFLIGSALSAAAWDMPSLVIFRGVQGLGAGSIMATVNTLAGDLYSVRERAYIQGWLSSVWGMAAILGPSLGGALAEYVSWRWIFLINIPVGLIAIALLMLFLKEKVVKRQHHLDFVGAGLMLASGMLLIFTLMQSGQSWPWFSVIGITMMAISVLLIMVTIRFEKRSPEPVMPDWIWRNRILAGSNLAMIGMGAIMIGPSMYLPVFSQSVLGVGAIAAGLILGSMTIGWPVASSFSGRAYLRIGFRNTAAIGAAVIGLASLGFALMPYEASPWMLVANHVILGAGFGLLSTPTLVGIQSIVPWKQRGVVTGGNMFSRYLGQSIGAAILGGVFNASMRNDLIKAPKPIKNQLPQDVNDVIDVLQSGVAGNESSDYLKHAFYIATHHVYGTMALLAFLTLVVLLFLPARYPLAEDEKDS